MKLQKAALLPPLALILSLAAGCSRQLSLMPASQTPVSGKELPFERSSTRDGMSPTESLSRSSIPAGTLITVRMQSKVSSAASHAGDSFEALLDEPVVIQGQTLLPKGVKLTGKVVSAKASGGAKDPGYLRLVLETIDLNDHSLPLQTSSIFVKTSSHEPWGPALVATATPHVSSRQDDNVVFAPQSHLTFRLSQSLPLPE